MDDVPAEIRKDYDCGCEHWIFEANKHESPFMPFMKTEYLEDYEWQALRLKMEYREYLPDIIATIAGYDCDIHNFWSTYFMGTLMFLPKCLRMIKSWVFSQPNPFAIDRAHYCSEIVVAAHESVGLDIAYNIGLNRDSICAKDFQRCTFFNRVRY